MDKSQFAYKLVASVVMIYILYALVNNFVVDPGAKMFLSHKTGLEHALKPRIWLTVLYIHIGFASFAMASGLLNLSSRTYEKHRGFHRANGYAYVSSVLVIVLTSGYMAPFATGGELSSMGFNLLNILWLAVTATALIQIFKKRMLRHRRWMIRSYAYCFTNMMIHLLTFVFNRMIGVDYAASYTIGLYGAIVLLAAAPEVFFRMEQRLRTDRNKR